MTKDDAVRRYALQLRRDERLSYRAIARLTQENFQLTKLHWTAVGKWCKKEGLGGQIKKPNKGG